MTTSTLRRLLTAATLTAAAITPALASPITFESTPQTVFSGESITVDYFKFTDNSKGFSVVSDAANFLTGNAPPNASGQFLSAFNGSGIGITQLYALPMIVTGFDFAFIAPISGLTPNAFAGRLHVEAELADGSTLLDILDFFPSNNDGNFEFGAASLTNIAGMQITSLNLFACTFDDNGDCDFGNLIIAPQFAIDNLRIQAVPLPGTLALGALSLGLLAFSRRRQVA